MTPRRVATIASPLQAMSLQEAVTAGAIDPPDVVVVQGPREAVAAIFELADATLGNAVVERPSVRWHLDLLRRAPEIIIGDPFSRLAHLALLVRRRGRVVVLEDGAAVLRAWRACASGTALVRAHERRFAASSLGRLAASRLRWLAEHADVLLVGGLPASADVAAALEARSITVIRHDFSWARSVSLPASEISQAIAASGRVVLGSALCVDGHIRRSTYERWLRQHLDSDRPVFLPHRRDERWTLQLAGELGARVSPSGHLCAELLLRDPSDELVIDGFPMTAALTVPLVRAERPTRLRLARPTGRDWTAGTPARMIDLVGEIADLAERITPTDPAVRW